MVSNIESEIAKKIVSFGYFSNKIPEEFNSENLGNELKSINIDEDYLDKTTKKISSPIDFSIPKSCSLRRNVAVPNPLGYVKLSKVIEENWDELQEHFDKSTISLTRPNLSDKDGVAIDSSFGWDEKTYRRISHLSTKRFILTTDITRYYPSIYTHSISWALHTKSIAKENRFSKDYLGNKLDELIRNMQDGQTVGIPIGPDVSSIIQEIIGTSIDDDFKERMGVEPSGWRYTDDIEYYFDSREEAEKGLATLSKVVKNYNLDLNSSKTSIVESPIELEPEWVYFFKTFEFRKSLNGQRRDLISFFSKAFEYSKNRCEKGILKYALNTVRKVVVEKNNWDVFESLILKVALLDTHSIPTVFETIEGYKYRGYKVNICRFREFINNLVIDGIDIKNDFEVSWGLALAKRLEIKISEEASKELLKSDNDIIILLTIMLNEKGLLSEDFDIEKYENLLSNDRNSDKLYSSNWLLAYECCNRGWLNKNTDSDYIENDKFFQQLLDKKVSFLDIDYSSIANTIKEVLNETNDLKISEEEMVKNSIELSEKLEWKVSEDFIKNIVEEISIERNREVDAVDKEAKKKEITFKKIINIKSPKSNNNWLKNFFNTNIKESSVINYNYNTNYKVSIDD